MLLQILIATLAAFTLSDGSPTAGPKAPSFGSSYQATGFVRLPYAELNETFQIYFDGKKKMARIDFYGGMDKSFYRGDEKPYGNLYEVSPVVAMKNSTKSMPTCFKLSGFKAAPVTLQSMLPDLKDFKFNGQKRVDGQLTDEWVMVTAPNPSKVNTYMFYVSRGSKVVPVRYEMMGYDTLLGSHYDKYIIDYTMFDNTSAINASVFDYPKSKLSWKENYFNLTITYKEMI